MYFSLVLQSIKGTHVRPLLLSFCLCFASTFCASQTINVQGKVNGSNARTVYLYQFHKVDWQVIDSATIKGGSFQLQLEIPHRGWYKLGPDLKSSFDVILGEPKLYAQVDASQNPWQSSYGGRSLENQHLKEYQGFLKNVQQETAGFQNALHNSGAKTKEEKLELQRQILDALQNLDQKKQRFYAMMSAKVESTLVRRIAAFHLLNPQDGVENYFKKEDFQEPELASSMYYQEKLYTYLRQLRLPDMTRVLEEINDLLGLTEPGSTPREALLISAIRLVQGGSPETVSLLARRYQMEYPESNLANQLMAVLPAPGPQIGDLAPDIMLKDPGGQDLALSSLRGKYVLLDFWASWCRPCRVEAPHVVDAFHRFSEQGFTIYSVSLDSNREKWLKAIEKDGLSWHHVSDLKGWKSAGAAKYGVRSIPATYLIDPQGKIIARNLRGSSLAQELTKTFKNTPKRIN